MNWVLMVVVAWLLLGIPIGWLIGRSVVIADSLDGLDVAREAPDSAAGHPFLDARWNPLACAADGSPPGGHRGRPALRGLPTARSWNG